MATSLNRKGQILQDPPLVQKIFSDTRAGWVWFLLRIWVGWQWVSAAEHKVTSPGWVVTGDSLKGFWTSAVAIPASGKPAIAYGWYRDFLQMLLNAGAYTWFGKLVAYGELLVGIALIIGAFTGIAAFFGALMNWNYIMAGAASTNGFLLVLAILLILAWKVAGFVGADYFLLRWIGTPWQALNPVPTEPTSTGKAKARKPGTAPAPGD